MKNGTRFFLITLIVLLLLGYVVAFAYCTYNKYAAAEEIALENIDENSILNFNQLISINSVNSSKFSIVNTNQIKCLQVPNDGSVRYFGITAFTLDTTHKYYAYGNTTGFRYIDDNTGTPHEFIGIFTGDGLNYSQIANYISYGSLVANQTYTFNIIDITLMLGVGNDNITLEECQELFKAQYYTYTTGTPITLNGFNEYNQALNDIFSNYKYMLDRNALSTQTQATNLMGTLSGTTMFGYNDENWYILGAMYCPLFTKISAASEFNIEIQLYAPNSSEKLLCFGTYIDNELNEIYSITFTGDGTTLDLNFTTPVDIQTLYVYQRNKSTAAIEEMNYVVGLFNIRVEQLDIASAVMSSYSSGYNTARDYYSEGGQGFADIFARGKAAGLIEANGTFTAMDYVKTAFITLGEILMIEVFPNFTLGAFFLLPLLTSTIFFIVKLTRGGS